MPCPHHDIKIVQRCNHKSVVAAETIEKQWNSQLARRFVLAIPRELPPEQCANLIRDYCREFFVSKGMTADFAIHDKGGRKSQRPHPSYHAGDGRNRKMAPQEPESLQP